jgi:hypothetical protein
MSLVMETPAKLKKAMLVTVKKNAIWRPVSLPI